MPRKRSSGYRARKDQQKRLTKNYRYKYSYSEILSVFITTATFVATDFAVITNLS
jgi:hypothetical protein